MPITSQLEKSKNLTVFTVTGILDFNNIIPVVKDFYEADPTKHVLWDMTGTTVANFTSEEVRDIVHFKPRFEGRREPGNTAIVANKDLCYGLSKMFEIQSNLKELPYIVKVFRSRDDANDWLETVGLHPKY